MGLLLATIVAGLLPVLAVWIRQRIMDGVVHVMLIDAAGNQAPEWPVMRFVLAEAGVLILLSTAQRALSMQLSLLWMRLV